MSDFYLPAVPPAAAEIVVEEAWNNGVRLFDTAGIYQDNEAILRQSLLRIGALDDATITTKVGQRRNPTNPDDRVLACRPEELRADLEQSANRLGRPPSVVFLHRIDPAIPLEDSVGALVDAARAGLAGGVGVCDVPVETLNAIGDSAEIRFAQYEISLFESDAIHGVVNACAALSIDLFGYSPLARGLLAPASQVWQGLQPADYRAGLTRLTGPDAEWNRGIVDGLRDLAVRNGLSVPQLSLAWVRSLGSHVTPLVGARDPSQLRELFDGPVNIEPSLASAARALVASREPRGAGRRSTSRILR